MNLEIFKNSGFELRGLINGEPYFVAMDIKDYYVVFNTRRLDDDEVQNRVVSRE